MWTGNRLADLAAGVAVSFYLPDPEAVKSFGQWMQQARLICYRLAFVEAWHRAQIPRLVQAPSLEALPGIPSLQEASSVAQGKLQTSGHKLFKQRRGLRCQVCLS